MDIGELVEIAILTPETIDGLVLWGVAHGHNDDHRIRI